MLMKKLVAGAATTALALALSTAVAHAQETTGGITGAITDDAGHGLAGVTVKVTYVPTHSTSTVTTGKDGFFSVRNLPVGGPYQVAAADSAHSTKTVEVAAIPLGSPYELNFTLEGGAPQTVTVTAARVRGTAAVQTGPRSTFTATDIQTLPSLNRDLKDLARLNPFVTIDPTNSNALVIAGNNNRYNTIYIDGVKQADDFGLNSNGYPTQRSPISTDLVQSLNVEIAPYDVQYGEFQGGVLSIVSKSGSNTPHGTAFYEYDGSRLGAGTQIGSRIVSNKFYDKNYGWTLGGPIIKDRLFFEAGYEKYESSSAVEFGPSDSNVANRIPGVTTADVTNIINILKTTYKFDPLNYSASKLPTQDKKWFVKLNAEINNNHRAFFSYQRTDGTQINTNDESTSNKTLSLLSDWYSAELLLQVYTGALYSHWTPQFSTELLYSHKTVDSLSNSLAGNDFANFRIFTPGGGSVFLGPNISRQANQLSNTTDFYRAKANYTIGDHVLTGGYEREELSVFNIFVQNANGAYIFGSATNPNGIALLQAQTATSLTYANASDNIKNDGAANWNNTINTFYIQDEWKPFSNVSLRFGLRDELYEQSVSPKFNQHFLTQYGFRNDATLDGKNIVLPRFGFNWRVTPDLLINGGVGLFSGGSPNVWISNDYTNTGNLLGAVSCTTTNLCSSSLTGVDGYNVGASAKTANTNSANLGTGVTNELDPKFRIPSVWKASIAARYTLNFTNYPQLGRVGNWLGDGWDIHGDYIYQKTKDALNWVDLWAQQNVAGTAPDGRPIYSAARYTVDPNRTTGYDLELTNTHQGYSKVWELGFGKSWSSGWDFDLTYINQDVKDVNPGTSSVAASNYGQNAVSNPNNPALAVSNYQIKDTIKLRLGYETKIWGDNKTSVRMYATKRSGLPFSYTFQSAATSGTAADAVFGESGVFASRSRELLYVPQADSTGNVTATSDPKVSYATSFNVADFNNFLHRTGLIGYAGQISPRNAFQSRDVTQVDLQFTQQFPAFFPGGAKAEFYFDIFNVGNLLNSNWGVLNQVGFPYFASDVTTTLRACAAGTGCATGQTNQYVYQSFTAKAPTVSNFTSLYALKIGFRYKF